MPDWRRTGWKIKRGRRRWRPLPPRQSGPGYGCHPRVGRVTVTKGQCVEAAVATGASPIDLR